MLTRHEERFLDLPESRLAIALDKKRRESLEGRGFRRIARSWSRILAFSLVLVGLIPLFELNLSAFDYLAKRRQLAELLGSAERLLQIDAISDARLQLDQARTLDPSNLRLLELQALIDLEETLRERQDKRALESIEIRYRKVLPSSAQAAYLLGTAYITADTDRAFDLLAQADRLNGDGHPTLAVRILAGRIWLLSRMFERDQSDHWLTRADALHSQALDIMKQHESLSWTNTRIALLTNYSFIKEQRAQAGDEVARQRALALASSAFQEALRSGKHLLIGKTAASLAHKLKDLGQVDEAEALVEYAILNSQLAKDDRGAYHATYTQGQLKFLAGDLAGAEEAYVRSSLSAVEHGDVRLQVLNTINRAKTAVLAGNLQHARKLAGHGRFLAEAIDDWYGVAEISLIVAFAAALDHPHGPIPEIDRDSCAKANMTRACAAWSQRLHGQNTSAPLLAEEDTFDAPFERAAWSAIRPEAAEMGAEQVGTGG